MTSNETSSSARTPGKDLLTFFNAKAGSPVRKFSEEGELWCAMRGTGGEETAVFYLDRFQRITSTGNSLRSKDIRLQELQESEVRIQKSETRSEPERRPPNAKPRTFESHSASMATT